MKTPDFRITLTIIVFFVALGILLGGNQGYQRYLVNQPLEQKLAVQPGIESADVDRVDGEVQITVHLRDVDNLQEEYIAIEKVLEDSLNKRPFRLVIADNSNDRLKMAFIRLQPAVYEAMASDRYVWLDESVKSYANQSGMNYRLYVDDRYVYIHLSDNGANLYRVIERQNKVQKIS